MPTVLNFWRRGGIVASVGEREVTGRSALVCLLFSTPISDLRETAEEWCSVFMALARESVLKEQAIRRTVDIPATLYRKLKEQAAARGRSIRELILLGVQVTLIEGKRPRSVKFPLITSDGPKVDLTSEQIYEHIEFP